MAEFPVICPCVCGLVWCDVKSLKSVHNWKNGCLRREIHIKWLSFLPVCINGTTTIRPNLYCYHVNIFKPKINKSLWINMGTCITRKNPFSFLWQFPMTHTNHYLCCRPSNILDLKRTHPTMSDARKPRKAIDGNCDNEKLKAETRCLQNNQQ